MLYFFKKEKKNLFTVSVELHKEGEKNLPLTDSFPRWLQQPVSKTLRDPEEARDSQLGSGLALAVETI